MSVTIWCPAAPRQRVTRPCTSPDMGVPCTAEERCGYCTDGQEQYEDTDAPEINLSNANARAVLGAAGLPSEGDLCGTLAHANIPNALQRIMRAVNADRVVESQVRPTVHERGTYGALLIDYGADAPYIQGRVVQLRDILMYASRNGYDVSWG